MANGWKTDKQDGGDKADKKYTGWKDAYKYKGIKGGDYEKQTINEIASGLNKVSARAHRWYFCVDVITMVIFIEITL